MLYLLMIASFMLHQIMSYQHVVKVYKFLLVLVQGLMTISRLFLVSGIRLVFSEYLFCMHFRNFRFIGLSLSSV